MHGLGEYSGRAGRERLVQAVDQPVHRAGAQVDQAGQAQQGDQGREQGQEPVVGQAPGGHAAAVAHEFLAGPLDACRASRSCPVPAACPGRQTPRSAAGSSRFLPCGGLPSRAVPALWLGHVGLLGGLLAFVARPDAGEFASALGGAAVDSGLDHGEDRALQGGGQQHFPPAPLGVGGLGRVIFRADDLPDFLEDRAGQYPAEHADQHAHRLVPQLDHRLLHRRITR